MIRNCPHSNTEVRLSAILRECFMMFEYLTWKNSKKFQKENILEKIFLFGEGQLHIGLT